MAPPYGGRQRRAKGFSPANDWAQALTDGADGLNAALNAAVARVSFAVVCGLVAGLPTGLVGTPDPA
ncbi:MAG: hypothetical protein SYR96_17930 [Actinomycetota bacterium]|nr:hypothetical protein [Actinomycetota bacterium]